MLYIGEKMLCMNREKDPSKVPHFDVYFLFMYYLGLKLNFVIFDSYFETSKNILKHINFFSKYTIIVYNLDTLTFTRLRNIGLNVLSIILTCSIMINSLMKSYPMI